MEEESIKIKTEDGHLLTIEMKKGERGEKGEQGESIKGEKGDTGIQGEQGIQGIPGTDGVDGKDGKDGLDGKDGKDGVDGKDGRPGKDLSEATIQKLEKVLKDKNSNLLWANSDSVKSVSDFELILATINGKNSYMEFTTDVNGNINQVNYWLDSSKAKKLFQKDIEYSGSNPTVVTMTNMETRKKLIKTIAYDSGDNVLSVTKIVI